MKTKHSRESLVATYRARTVAQLILVLLAVLLRHELALGDQCSIPAFAAPRTFNAGYLPAAVATGDFNKDGSQDVAVISQDSTNTLLICLGNGNGTLQTPIIYTVGSFPQRVQVVDLNGDSNPDLAVGRGASAQLAGLLGDGSGTFQSPMVITGAVAQSFAFGRFGSDTNLDLVSGNSGDLAIYVQQGNGNGTFQSLAQYFVAPFGAAVGSVAVGDMNNDGKTDIVVGTIELSTGHINIFLGKGDGTFLNPSNSVALLNNSVLALADFNRDGSNDIATANFDAGTLRILLGNGNGTLQSNATFSVGPNPQSIAVGDLNADQNPDLLVGAGTNITVLVGNGDGTFQAPRLYLGLERAMALADFNGDGRQDLVSAVSGGVGKIGVSLGNGDATFQIAPFYAVRRQPETAAVGDFNGDGWGDMVVANSNTNSVSVLLNNGNGTFQPAVNYITANKPFGVAVGDFNGDGTNDIAATTANSTNMVSILLGNGNGTFQPAVRHGTFGFGGAIVLRDFNGDGKLDMICTSLSGIQVQLGNGNGTFQPATSGLTGAIATGPGSMAIADFNGDHTNDLALANNSTNVAIYLGAPNGNWLPAVNRYLTGTNTQSVAAGDFNGDGTNDLAAANFGTPSAPDGTVSIILGNGNGTFRPPTHFYGGAHPRFVATADFNGDGILDLVVRNLIEFGVTVLLGNGDGTFQSAFGFGGLNDSSFTALAIGDLNADGKPDLALPNLGDSVSVLLNTCASASAPPRLSLVRSNSSSFVISWPLASAGFSLQFTTNLSSSIWQAADGPLSTNNGNVEVTVPFDQQQRFFRLGQ